MKDSINNENKICLILLIFFFVSLFFITLFCDGVIYAILLNLNFVFYISIFYILSKLKNFKKHE